VQVDPYHLYAGSIEEQDLASYQRAADFTTRTLSDGSGNPVAISIDPFYFSVPVLP